MAKKKKDEKINTDGGAYIAGNVNTGGGDFVGHDKNVKMQGGVYIGGDAKDSNIIVGNGNVVGGNRTENIFAPVYQAIQNTALSPQEKEDLQAEVEEVEGEIVKAAEEVDESFLARRLRSVKRMAPDIFDLMLSALKGPGAVVSAVGKKIAERVKAEAG